MNKVSLQGVIDMHVHTNPDLRHRAYDDFELTDAAVRVGARAIVYYKMGKTETAAEHAPVYLRKSQAERELEAKGKTLE